MTFAEAMQALVEGKKVKRAAWAIKDRWWQLIGSQVQWTDNGNPSVLLHRENITATDWQVMPERIKGWVNVYPGQIHHSHDEAVRQAKLDQRTSVTKLQQAVACIEIDCPEGQGL